MAALLREGMAEGAFGLSSGLDYPPGSYATTDELADLAREAGRSGGIYHTHVRYPLGDRYLDPFLEAIEICQETGDRHGFSLVNRLAAVDHRGNKRAYLLGAFGIPGHLSILGCAGRHTAELADTSRQRPD